MSPSCDRDFIDAVAFVVSIYNDRHLLMAGRHDAAVQTLAFVYGHDEEWIADHIQRRLLDGAPHPDAARLAA